ncbi:MAG: ribonuclease HI family protein [Patescibacteria group bacterium]
MTSYRIFTDGGARGNPGPSACAFVVYDGENLIYKQGFYLGISTNNQAEYQGVLKAAEYCSLLIAHCSVTFYLDSLLVVKQMRGEYKIKDPKLKILHDKIKNYKLKIDFVHVPREQNRDADALVNKTLDGEYENE